MDFGLIRHPPQSVNTEERGCSNRNGKQWDATIFNKSSGGQHLSELRWARLFGSNVGTPVGPQKAQKNMSGPLRRLVTVFLQTSDKVTLLTLVAFMSEHLSSSRWPSEWLKLGASKVDLFAQSVWIGKWPETHLSDNHEGDTPKKD